MELRTNPLTDNMDIKTIDPNGYANWDAFVLERPHYSVFQSTAWARVLSDTYRYKPLYFSVMNGRNPVASLPVMEVRSLLTGSRGVSLPFSDYCSPIADDRNQMEHLVNRAVEYGKTEGWKYLELRGAALLPSQTPSCNRFFTHYLPLTKDEDALFSAFRSNTKRNIKKGLREEIVTSIQNSRAGMDAYYALHCLTRKKHGIPPQPKSFFHNIFKYVIQNDGGIIVIGSLRNKPVAGSVFLHFGNYATYKFGASDEAFHHFRPNNVIMWEAIKYYARRGLQGLDFGRTDILNQGLANFKEGWGAERRILHYHQYDIRQETFIGRQNRIPEYMLRLFRMLPIPLLQLFGNMLYRHIG